MRQTVALDMVFLALIVVKMVFIALGPRDNLESGSTSVFILISVLEQQPATRGGGGLCDVCIVRYAGTILIFVRRQ